VKSRGLDNCDAIGHTLSSGTRKERPLPEKFLADTITTISLAISSAKRLRDISKNIGAAEFKNVLANLLSELADAKVEMAALKNQLAEQAEEIRLLKAADPAERERPLGVKWGCYEFVGEGEKLYCTACYDLKGVKILVTRLDSEFRQCPVCKALMGAG